MGSNSVAEQEAMKKAREKMRTMEQEYWQLRNDKKEYMRCPYCLGMNYVNDVFCCKLFSMAFAAILERQEEVDKAMKAMDILKTMETGGLPN